jgi:hypothetical protein
MRSYLTAQMFFYIIFKNRFNKAEIAMQENGVVTLMNKNAG